VLQVDEGDDDGRVGDGKEKEVMTVAVRQNGGRATDRIPFLGSAIRGGNEFLPPNEHPGCGENGRQSRSQLSSWVGRASDPLQPPTGPRSDVRRIHRQSERCSLCRWG
jgi:hypothetical protein